MSAALNFLRVVACAARSDPRKTLRGIGWMLRGKRVRGRNLIYAAASRSPRYYNLWIRVAEPKIVDAFCGETGNLGRMRFAVLLVEPDGCSADRIKHSEDAIKAAFGRDVCIVRHDPQKTLVSALAEIRDGADYVVPVLAGDLPAAAAGQTFSAQAASFDTDVIYGDEDTIAKGARGDPWFKPDWDPLFFLARDGVTGACAIRLEAACAAARPLAELQFGTDSVGKLILNAVAAAPDNRIAHVPLIVVHRPANSMFLTTDGRRHHLTNIWPEPLELMVGGAPSELVVRFPEPVRWPSVTIVVPTRDGLVLLKNCIEGIRNLTYNGRLQTVVADNDSSDPETLRYFAELRKTGIDVLHSPGSFNFSRINNKIVEITESEFILLLNNDIEMIDGDWLQRLMVHAMRERVGAVGALLLYPDFTIQHAGVAVGIGGAAGHVYRGSSLDDPVNRGTFRTTRRVTIVTGACLLVRRETYVGVGGLNEEDYAVAFNDVDFCLRLDAAGLRNILVGEARLIHHESKTRGDDMSQENFARYKKELGALQAQWHTIGRVDRWHSPMLSKATEDFVPSLSA